MKAQFINIMKGAACLFLVQLSITASAVVPAVPAWLAPFKNLANKNLVYNYIVQLVDDNGVMTDSLKGRMYRSGNHYLDSNEINVTVTDGIYFCKIDHERKTSIVCSVPAMERKLHTKMTTEPFAAMNIPDSVFAKYGSLKTDSTADTYIAKLTIATPEARTSLTAFISRRSYTVERLIIDAQEPKANGEKTAWRRRCVMYDINDKMPSGLFDLTRFFTISGNMVSLNNKYANYKLTSLIN